MDQDDVRSRILDAAVAAAGQVGLAKLTIDEVARSAGTSRATVYRAFPAGRDQVLAEAIAWEVRRFFIRLAEEVDDAPDFATRLERGLLFAHLAIAEHEVLQKVVETEPERLLPQLSNTGPMVVAVLRGYLEPLLAAEDLCDGVDAEAAADWLARNILSFIIAEGSWSLDDPASVRRLVREQLLVGVVRSAG